ncbi:MAG: hypothetical protein IT425_11300, partial [Pirellulales bacterium]|nr:hypothetical protein [Pirellulales bacterium]
LFRLGWPRTGGIRRKLLVLLVLTVVLIAVLPTIIAKTPLRNLVLNQAVPTRSLRISVGEASLGWFSGPSLGHVQLTDPAGVSLLTAESIRLDRAPLSLALNSHDLGQLRIDQPQLFLKVRPDGSNLEDLLHEVLAEFASRAAPTEEPAPPRGAPLVLGVQLSNGTIVIEDLATSRVWRLDGLNAQLNSHGGGWSLDSLTATLALANPNGTTTPAGRIGLAAKPNGNRIELALQAEALALAAAEPWLRRFAPGSELSGTLSGNGTASWNADPTRVNPELASAGAITIDSLDATAPALAGDRLRLNRVELPWKLTSQTTGLVIEQLQLNSDIGKIELRGQIDPSTVSPVSAAASAGTAESPGRLGGNSDVELRGAVDLARLAAMLPRAIHLRQDTTLTSGSIQLVAHLQPTADGQSLSGSLQTADLAANSSGKPIRWEDPIAANFALRNSQGMLSLDSLDCESKFLRAKAAGNFQKFAANATFDLGSLARQLEQFLDLSGVQMVGGGTAQLHWHLAQGNQFQATATSELAHIHVALGPEAAWDEPQLNLQLEATGSLDPGTQQPTHLATAQLQVNGQGDLLDARLTSPVALKQSDAAWPLALRATGSIARWLARARPWFTPGEWKIDGTSELVATLRVSSHAIVISEARGAISNLRADGPGWNISEPRVEFTGDAQWNGGSGEIASGSAQLVSSSFSLASKGVRYVPSPPGTHGISQLGGAAAFRADLARVAAWQAPVIASTKYTPAGEVTGNLRFAQQGDRVSGELAATANNLLLRATTNSPSTPVTQTIWQEPQLTLRGITNYDATADRLSLEQFQVQSNTLQANIVGAIDHLTTVAECTLSGAANYDLAQLSPLLRPYVGEGVQLVGREQARFAVAGKLGAEEGTPAQLTSLSNAPYRADSAANASAAALQAKGINSPHWSRRIRANVELPWSGASVYGLPIGPGKLTLAVAEGSLQVAPLALPVEQGHLNVAPRVRFDPPPSELTMPAGSVITNVRISPEVSDAMLKFMAPVLAGATRSEGEFSMHLDGLRMPLENSKLTDAAGKLTVHQVRVTPGPMIQPWVELARQVEAIAKRRDPAALASRPPTTLLAIRDQQVNFRVVNGRVYHETMEFQVGDVVLQTQGSVGLDETIAFNLLIPIQDKWIEKEPLLAGLRGQSLQVPISGTLQHPQMDQRAVANLSSQLIQNAAGQAVGNEINKALDKLLKPRK